MKARGWTLIELLIVLAIVALLLSLFVPALYHFIKYVRHLGMWH